MKSNDISLDDDCTWTRTGPTGFFQDEEFAKRAEYRNESDASHVIIVLPIRVSAGKKFDKITVIKAITVIVNTDEVDRISIALSTANDYRA